MTRAASALDRAASLLVGLVLIAVGGGAVAWQQGHLDRVGPVLDVGWLPEVVRSSWWPWVSTVVGALLVLLAILWLAAHLPRRGPTAVTLAGSGASGRLEANLRVAANHAATALAASPAIRSARGRPITDRGLDTIELLAQIPPDADLAEAVAAVERITADLTRSLGEMTPPIRTRLRVGRASSGSSRAAG